MKIDPKQQAETIAELAARCEGRDQFQKFDNAFRSCLSVPKEAVLKEDVRWKRARAKRRARKTR